MIEKNNRFEKIVLLLVPIFIVLFIEKIVFCTEKFNFSRALIFFSIIVLFVIISLLLSKLEIDEKIKKTFKYFNINIVFVILCLIFGLSSSLLFPFTQIPDEVTHINMTYDERNLDVKFFDVDSDFSGYENANDYGLIDTDIYFDLSKKIDMNYRFSIPNIMIIRHLPQFFGMIVGEVFNLPVFLYLTICELFALFFYTCVCNIALKKIPIKKNLFMMIMLLPICIQQMASFSYDVVLNSFCFLYIAYIFNLKFSQQKITNKDFLFLAMMLFVIGICKIPYILFALLILILPCSKIELTFFNKKILLSNIKEKVVKHKIVSSIIFLVLLLILVIGSVYVLNKILIGRIVLASILHFKDSLSLLIRSAKIFLSYYFETIVGNLGIFNVKTSVFFEIFIYCSLLFITFYNISYGKKNNEKKFSIYDLFVIYFVCCIFIYLIIFSMFEWTMYCTHIPNYKNFTISDISIYINKLPYIGGVQGRYFVPVLPLILIPISSKKLYNLVCKFNPILFQIMYYLLLYSYLFYVLINRYWI